MSSTGGGERQVVPWQRYLYAIFAAELLAITGFSVSMPLIPFYLQELGLHESTNLKVWVGAVNALGSLALAGMAPIWGRLADQYGRRIMLLRAMFGGAVFLGLMGLVNRPWQLLVLRTLQGAVTGTVTAANVMVASITPRKRIGYGLGVVQTAIFAGSSLGPLVGGIIADYLGYRLAFMVTSLFLAAGGLILLKFTEEQFVPKPREGPFWKTLLPDFGVAVRNKTLIVVFLIVFTVYMSYSVIGPILPLYIQGISADPERIGLITGLTFGLGALSAALSSATLGRISYRIGYRKVLLACIIGSMMLYIPQAFVTAPWQLFILRVAIGVFIGGTMPAANSIIATSTDESAQGQVYGLSSSVSAGGMALGPVLAATVSVLWGYPAVFLATSALLAVLSLVIIAFYGRLAQ